LSKIQQIANENKINRKYEILFLILNAIFSDNKDEIMRIKKKMKNNLTKKLIYDFNLDIDEFFIKKLKIKIPSINSDIKLLNTKEIGNNNTK
jgi:predicted metalloprotease